MGAGILPTTIHNNKLYFLFGRENQFEKSAPGFSDFGGGTDNNESYLETAIREGGEELTGFLGNDEELKTLLEKHGTYNIDIPSGKNKIYRVHIFPMEYDEKLPFYYNNNQRFLQKRLDQEIIKKSKIFEKEEIRWIPINELNSMKLQFRFFFPPVIDKINNEREKIKNFIKKGLGITTKKFVQRKDKTRKTRKNYKKLY